MLPIEEEAIADLEFLLKALQGTHLEAVHSESAKLELYFADKRIIIKAQLLDEKPILTWGLDVLKHNNSEKATIQ